MEGKIAVIGDTDFVMPFSELGLDTYVAGQSDKEISDAARKVAGEKYALVVVAEDILHVVQGAFSAYQDMPTPCVVAVPFTTESKGLATQALARSLKLATGIDILQGT